MDRERHRHSHQFTPALRSCGKQRRDAGYAIFVSRAEWEFAADPSSAQAVLYDISWTGPDLTYMNYTLISSDHYDVLPGVRIIETPGHTPGHQSVLVNTAEGILCVTGMRHA
jgi:glyoxylase-like metal-dependent hydrolase (beta-lactamase superfamily II)